LLRDVARTWESGLADRAEAIDAWKDVLSAAPGDAEASAAIERLNEASAQRESLPLRPSGDAILASSGSIPPPPPPGARTSRPPRADQTEPFSVDGIELLDEDEDASEPDER